MFKNEKLLIFINGKSISEIFLQAYFLLCIMLGGVFLATKLAWKMIGHCFNGNFFSTFCVHMLWLSIFCQSLSSFFSIEEILTFSNVCWWDEKNPIFDFAVRKRMGKTSNIVYFFCRVQKLLIWSLTSIRSCTCEYSNNYLRIKQHTTQNVVFVTIKYFITPLHFQTRQMKMIPIRFFLKIKGLE